jgi:S1-C subfamily serine protease
VITAEVWERVVRVACGRVTGTGFTLEHEGGHYVVTARHVVESGAPVQVLVRGKAAAVQLTPLNVPVQEADVAVFRLDRPITPPGLPLAAGTEGMIFGQDAYFLGFPLGMTFDLGDEYFPLVKRCTVSGTTQHYEGRTILLLDGWNNPGFSGGPVVFRPLTAAGMQEPMRVAGIVTAYRPEAGPVTVGGNVVPGAEVLLNTGIIIAEQITRATEAIEAGTLLC